LLSLSKGFPPKVILLRQGNQSNKYIATLLKMKKEEVDIFAIDTNYGILEIL